LTYDLKKIDTIVKEECEGCENYQARLENIDNSTDETIEMF